MECRGEQVDVKHTSVIRAVIDSSASLASRIAGYEAPLISERAATRGRNGRWL
jgi:hypothetical protein